MPSSTALLETEEGESEVPPPLVHAFAGIGLGNQGTHSQTPEQAGDSFPHYSFLGAVLDLKPLSNHQSIEEKNGAVATDEESEVAVNNGKGNLNGSASTLLAQAHNHHVFLGPGGESVMPSGIEPPPPETILLYNNDDLDDAGGLHSSNGMILLPSEMYGGESSYEMEQSLLMRRKSVNTTECVAVPSSEHVAEIVGRQGCKIKALRAKTNTYIKTPVRGDQPVFVVTGRKEDVAMAKREILSAAEHFSLIRASRNKTGPLSVVAGPGLPGAPTLPGQTTIQVRVPYRVVGLVVGPKGATIKRIQQQTHTYIVTPSRDKEPVFEVTGMPENVDRAREEIEAHIALRTGTCGGMELPGVDDNDFHFNGTDVSFEGLSAAAAAAGMGHAAWLQSNAAASAAGGLPAMGVTGGGGGTPQVNGNFSGGVKMSSTYRNDSSSSLGSGSSSADSFYGNGNLNRMADFSPTCSVNANNNNNNGGGVGGGGGGGAGASFWFGDAAQPLGSEEMGGIGVGGPASGFDPLTISTAPGSTPLPQPPVWSSYVEHQAHEAGKTQTSHPGTPRLSPTFLCTDALEHPQAQRVQRASLGTTGAPESHRFSGYGPAFSSSSESTASASSSSPPDSSLPFRAAAAAAAAAAAGRGVETCIHCMESQVVAALVPCGHNLFCMECATRICHGPDAVCPVCFYPVTQAIQLRNM
ncbi:RNA-binding protein MEX3B-like [Gadus chalcogrammus]|uniref:RNA-binding protein MEX3B-like n=1 Tax=Gadus chalcogrammus TaxID=1042646 RepID=UPI0024C24506|nr:RNA-binding protein MEX3B-like [Gadus chalcogrammus]